MVLLSSCNVQMVTYTCGVIYSDRWFPLSCTLECKCNGHAESCHFDWAAWRESGQRSGGVCNCLHNTEGRQCQKCKPGFYRDPQRPQMAPDVCKRKTHTHPLTESKLFSILSYPIKNRGFKLHYIYLALVRSTLGDK